MSSPPARGGLAPRAHHFYVAMAKFVFAHDANGIAWSSDPICLADAADLGLRPLILYGLTVPGTPIRWLGYTHADRPRAFADFVHQAWASAAGLRGYPDDVMINRHVATAAPGFVASLTKLGVHVVTAGPAEKSHAASLRGAQQAAFRTCFRARNRAPIANVEALNAESAAWHATLLELGWRRGMAARATAERCEAWMKLPPRGTLGLSTRKLDWTPGPWLSAWEATLPPGRALYLEEVNDMIFVRTGEAVAPDDTLDSGSADRWAAKLLVSTWPNDATRIAKAVGLTAKELRWYLDGSASIPPEAEVRLRTLLGLEYAPYQGTDVPEGPCVLVAQSMHTTVEVYEALSHGGDLEYSFEPLPERGSPDPSWRYLLFQRYGSLPNVLMLTRGSRITERLGERFINFEGDRKVPARVYRDLVSTCARACADPRVNRAEMIEFAKRQGEFLAECCEGR